MRPADESQVEAAAAILSSVAGRPATSPGRGVVSVPVASDATFADVVRRLADAGITATELSLHLPSLDEVFFTLTGRTVGDDRPADGLPATRTSTESDRHESDGPPMTTLDLTTARSGAARAARPRAAQPVRSPGARCSGSGARPSSCST